MKEERGVLQDVVGTDQPNNEGKVKRYVRTVLMILFMSFFVLLVVMAALRRYGS
jgi:hypothetical protein